LRGAFVDFVERADFVTIDEILDDSGDSPWQMRSLCCGSSYAAISARVPERDFDAFVGSDELELAVVFARPHLIVEITLSKCSKLLCPHGLSKLPIPDPKTLIPWNRDCEKTAAQARERADAKRA